MFEFPESGGWLTDARLITPRGVREGAVRVVRGRIAAVAQRAPRGAAVQRLRGAWLAPGLIDLHVWGDPEAVSRDAVRQGTTSFLTTLGPAARTALARQIRMRTAAGPLAGAQCLGVHLEGPFVNRRRRGALPARWMRAPTVTELRRLREQSSGCLRMITLAPELAQAETAIRWCVRHRIVVSLGHSEATAMIAASAVDAGARAVTHVFNGMPPWHHRRPSLVDVALLDPRVITMVIADGIHVGPWALQMLMRAKDPERVALVTDSIRRAGWPVVKRQGAFYLPAPRGARQAGRRDGTLAGSDLGLLQAVCNMVRWTGVPVETAVRMASTVPARLLGLRDRGAIAVGPRADLVAFDAGFRPVMTMVGGRVVYERT